MALLLLTEFATTAEAQTDTVEPSPTATTTNAGHTTGQAPPASEIALKQLLGPVRPSIILAFCCGMAGAALGLLPAIGAPLFGLIHLLTRS